MNGLPREVHYENLTWTELRDRVKEGCDIAILTIGSVEEHGPHLPLGMDTFFIYEVARRGAERVSGEVGALILPPIWMGNSTETRDFPGTIDIDITVLSQYVEQVLRNLIRHGFKKIVVVSGHDPNGDAVFPAFRRLKTDMKENRCGKAFLVFVPPWDLALDVIKSLAEEQIYGHGDEIETSTTMYVKPELVKPENMAERSVALKEIPLYTLKEYGGGKVFDGPYPYRPVRIIWEYSGMKTGAIGPADKASKEKGEKIVNAWVDAFAKFLKDLKKEVVPDEHYTTMTH